MKVTALPEQRRLIVMRHAKSSHDGDAETDHARPLNKRGRSDAPRVAGHLAKIGWRPDFILSSDAQRTRETLDELQHGFGGPLAHLLCAPLYLGGYQELLSVAKSLPASVETALVLGHNPGWEDVVEVLTGQAVVLKTATSALLVLAEACPWPEALRKCGDWRLENVVYPREI